MGMGRILNYMELNTPLGEKIIIFEPFEVHDWLKEYCLRVVVIAANVTDFIEQPSASSVQVISNNLNY